MDNFFKNLKEKLSIDNFMNLVKESKIVQSINKEEVTDTLQKLDPRNISTEDITKTVNSLTEQSKQVIEEVGKTVTEESSKIKEVAKVVEVAKNVDTVKIVEVAKAGFNILKKSSNTLKEDAKSDTEDDLDPVWDS